MEKEKKTSRPGNSFKIGALALVFLILGYQVAVFVREASVSSIAAHKDSPDTVYVYLGDSSVNTMTQVETRDIAPGTRVPDFVSVHHSEHSPEASRIYEETHEKEFENFRFNPNTVSVEDLCRLGFSEKQARSIVNYRLKGGHFNRKSDFARSFVVADSVYRRLEPFIDIPLVDINTADSAAFDALPGIGPYYAAKMVELREQLGGYKSTDQLLEIWNFGQERLDAINDLICVGGVPE